MYRRRDRILRIIVIAAMALEFMALEPLQAYARPGQYVPRQIILKLKAGNGLEDIQELNNACRVISIEKAFLPAGG